MDNPLITAALVVLTLLSLAASGLALRRLFARSSGRIATRAEQLLITACSLGLLAVFLYRKIQMGPGWQPLEAHVDGLVLIGLLFGVVILFLQQRPRLGGLDAFGLPLLTVILAWSVCASAWTYRAFDLNTLHPVWMAVHLAGVYMGTLSSAVAAIAGGTFLYVQHRLRSKQNIADTGRLANLESLESLIIRTATIGFALLTLGLLAGLVIQTGGGAASRLGPGWWHSPKVLLAVLAWAVYAVVMNVRFGSAFRGARAAWLSIFGLVLLLATYGVVTALPNARDDARPTRAPSSETPR
ncbi:MAG: cytochrome c biogenesis protein [Planctomycetes bacterium]|nr:cytochrome c biogenesis protein [Planctomycetota bacterium]